MSDSPDPKILLRWFDEHRRDLPWRRDRDPYRIWVSEVMLQQTQVRTVIPYYEAFLERFPSVGDLAAAPVDEVLALWSGLGYYRRARQMHEAAREVAQAGAFPSSAAELVRLPGIGPYTAAAVASMAFGEKVAVLDGNVERLLCRLHALEGDPKKSVLRRRLQALAAELLTPRRPGDGNQALMEIGATVCLPRGPRCGKCPLASACRALLEGDPERYPPPRARRETEQVVLSVALVQKKGRTLFFRRSESAPFLAGTWELPNVESGNGSLTAALAAAYGGRWTLGEECFEVRHAVTYRSLRLRVHRASYVAGSAGKGAGPEAAWLDDGGQSEHRPLGGNEGGHYVISSMFAKVLTKASRC